MCRPIFTNLSRLLLGCLLFLDLRSLQGEQPSQRGIPISIQKRLLEVSNVQFKCDVPKRLFGDEGTLLKRSILADREYSLPRYVRFLSDLGSDFRKYRAPANKVSERQADFAKRVLRRIIRPAFVPAQDQFQVNVFKDVPTSKLLDWANGGAEPHDFLRISFESHGNRFVVDYLWKWISVAVYPLGVATAKSHPNLDQTLLLFNKYFDLAQETFTENENREEPRLEDVSSSEFLGSFVMYMRPKLWSSPDSYVAKGVAEDFMKPLTMSARSQSWEQQSKIAIVTDGQFIIIGVVPWGSGGRPVLGSSVLRDSDW